MSKTPIVLLALILVACSSIPPSSGSNALATASIQTITPSPGAEVASTAVIKAEIQYAIENFDSRSEYYLAPLFASKEGLGRTFNELERISDAWKLTQPSGTVHVQYPIAREWRSRSLVKPARLNFKI